MTVDHQPGQHSDRASCSAMNPSPLRLLQGRFEADIGPTMTAMSEIWAQRLNEPRFEDPPRSFESSSESVDEFGVPAQLVSKHGNTFALKVTISAMGLEPCCPSFSSVRGFHLSSLSRADIDPKASIFTSPCLPRLLVFGPILWLTLTTALHHGCLAAQGHVANRRPV